MGSLTIRKEGEGSAKGNAGKERSYLLNSSALLSLFRLRGLKGRGFQFRRGNLFFRAKFTFLCDNLTLAAEGAVRRQSLVR